MSEFDVKRDIKPNRTHNAKNQTEDFPSSERKCVIEGKSFIVIRHFTGYKNLNGILPDIAVNRANKETGL